MGLHCRPSSALLLPATCLATLLLVSEVHAQSPTLSPPQQIPRPSGGRLTPGKRPPRDHGESLERLGVSMDQVPRLGNDGNFLPESYSPFGSSFVLDRRAELFVGGVVVTGAGSGTLFEDLAPDPTNPPVLSTWPYSWMLDDQPVNDCSRQPTTTRAVTAADVDGDGFEELAAVYVTGIDVVLHVIDDAGAGYGESEVLLGNELDVGDVAVAGGDLDGDGKDELVVGLCTPSNAQLWFVNAFAGSFVVEQASTKTIMLEALNPPDSFASFEIETGELDYDIGEELAVVLNEVPFPGSPGGVSRYFVYDDEANGLAELAGGHVERMLQDGSVALASVADLALGDIDGDNLDELVLGGLVMLGDCPGPGATLPLEGLFIAFDDAVAGLASIGGRNIFPLVGDPYKDFLSLRFMHVNAADVDGDRRAEVVANHLVFEDWVESPPWTEATDYTGSMLFSPLDLYGDENQGDRWYDQGTSALVTDDVNGDGYDDILSYSTILPDVVRIWAGGEDDFAFSTGLSVVGGNAGNAPNPILVPVNVDEDSPVLGYVGEHVLDFTEPLILAAMAAPPCKIGVGQNLDACQTTFGNTVASGTEEERTVTVSARGTVGVQIDGGISQTEASLKASVTAAATFLESTAYTLEISTIYTASPNVDAVLFTTVPMDRYTFTTLVHEDPMLVGREVNVYLPRDPVTLFVTRDFYNANVVRTGLQIDDSVFQHQIGDADSYPTVVEKNLILQANGGLEAGPVSVAQAGPVTQEISVGTAYNIGEALEMGFEIEAELVAGGVLAGFTVGASASSSLTVTSGASTQYSGTVGEIDAAHFAQEVYQWGLFTYTQLDMATGQEFEVINYWTEDL